MKSLHLTKQQARHLVMSLDAGSSQALNIGQLRRISAILEKASESIADFNAEIDRITRQVKDVKERDQLHDMLTNTDGQDPVSLEFDESDYDLLKGQWSGMQFSSNKFAREIILGIDDAMQLAEKETEKVPDATTH